jgi:wyosine [tRNA(Phe)-imidazoG37] synthetase (radical SAM superfamily)
VSRARRNIIRQNQQGGHPDCAGCPHLVTKRWPEPAHDVYLVGIAHFVRCNIFCNYCFLQTQDPESFKQGLDPYSVAPAIDALIRDGRLAPDATFDWGGGEPAIYREFDQLLKTVSERGGTTWVHTNGSRFPPPMAEGMPNENVRMICSVDAGFPSTYAQMKGRDYLERVWRNLERFIDAGCSVHVKYIVKDENCASAELEEFVKRAAAIGTKQIIVDLDYDFPNPSRQVLDGMILLRRLAIQHGMQATFGATGAQVLPEFDEARRAWEQADKADAAERQPVLIRVANKLGDLGLSRLVRSPADPAQDDSLPWSLKVRSALSGEALQATFDGPVAAVEAEPGQLSLSGAVPGAFVTVKAFGHKPLVLEGGAGTSEVALEPATVHPDEVFGMLNGFTIAEIPNATPDSSGKLKTPFDAGEEFDRNVVWSQARFLLHRSLSATLLVVSMKPSRAVGTHLHHGLAQAVATTTGGEVERLEIDGATLYAGHPNERLHWIALARHSVLLVVLSQDSAFADGIARSVVRQIR